MTNPNEKKQVVEWSFSFDNLASKISEQIKKVGVGDVEIRHDHFSTPAEGVTSARVELDLPVGHTTLKAVENSANLIEADVTYVGEMQFEVSGESVKQVKLSQTRPKGPFVGTVGRSIRDGIGGLFNNEELKWDVTLAAHIPMVLEIEGGVGASNLDLNGLRLTQFKLEGGVGDIRLTLPATGAHYEASVEGGVGGTQITIAEGASLHLELEAGVGGVNVTVPAAAAVRITVESGLGGVSLPADFKRIKGKDELIGRSGVWESEGYALSQQQITIAFEGGVGGFKLARS